MGSDRGSGYRNIDGQLRRTRSSDRGCRSDPDGNLSRGAVGGPAKPARQARPARPSRQPTPPRPARQARRPRAARQSSWSRRSFGEFMLGG
ncbi:4-fold beta flower protein [Clavibacter michiganensis]|uniref:4-fold beta flower protein n=1 Tax=Clavibacter michiganensis TaxID=28447 RepID=UPI003B3B9831